LGKIGGVAHRGREVIAPCSMRKEQAMCGCGRRRGGAGTEARERGYAHLWWGGTTNLVVRLLYERVF
jgi:hypothetical protein